VEGDVLLNDLGEGIPFRAGAFDGAISIRETTALFITVFSLVTINLSDVF
jgi:hypothetical protein